MAQVGYYKINKQYTEDDIMTFEDFNYIEDDIELIMEELRNLGYAKSDNLWDITKQNIASKMTFDNNTKIYSATDNDTRNYLQYKIQQYNGSTYISGTQVNSNPITQTGKLVLSSTRIENSTRLRIANNGAISEFNLFYDFPEEIEVGDKYTIALDLIDITMGATKFKNVQLLKGQYTIDNIPAYQPYKDISYTPKTWTKSDFLLYTYLNNIEEGLENIGKAYFRPYGWQDKKVWTGGMGFSYRDVNRWINNINLIVDRLDNESSTLFPSDTLYPSETLLPH